MPQHIDKCPLCGHATPLLLTPLPGYQSGSSYNIYECANCLASFADPLEVEDAIYDLIYENISFVPGYNRYHHYAHAVLKQKNPLAYLGAQEESYWAVARHLDSLKSAGRQPAILEVGSGMGYFTYAMHRAGFTVTGVDLSATAIGWASEHYGKFYECCTMKHLHDAGKRYDLIVMNQLIEHIPNVNSFIAEALSLLTPAGEFLLTTPNKTAYPEAQWETELPPVHLWWFGMEAMKYLADRHECAIEFVDFTSYYAAIATVKNSGTPVSERRPVFDENGKLIAAQSLAENSRLYKFLDDYGQIEPLRRLNMKLKGLNILQGSTGPISACILRRGKAQHE